MKTWLTLVGLGCLGAYFLTPVAKKLASQIGLVDHPDGRRKLHRNPIPLAGGVSIFFTLWTLVALLASFGDDSQSLFLQNLPFLFALLVSSALIFVLGIADDIGKLRGRHKLLGQFLAIAIFICNAEPVRKISLFQTEVDLGLLAIPFTLFWLVGAINSINLLDGMDGVLGTLGVILSLGLAVLGFLNGHPAEAAIALLLAGALLGFLMYNFPPASTFLGDNGSMFVGLMLGILSLRCCADEAGTVPMLLPLGIFALPILDTLAAILRRKLTGRSLYCTDLGHIHHCLLGRGFTPRQVLAVMGVLASFTVTGAIFGQQYQSDLMPLTAGVGACFWLVAMDWFGRCEWVLARRTLEKLAYSWLKVGGSKKFRKMEVHLQGSWNWNLDGIVEHLAELNLKSVRLDIHCPPLKESYHGHWDKVERELEPEPIWRVEMPIWARGHSMGMLAIVGYCDVEPISQKIAVVTRLIENFEREFSGEWKHIPAVTVHPARVEGTKPRLKVLTGGS